MLHTIKQYRSFILLAFIWLVVWFLPWGKIPTLQDGNVLAFLTEMPRLGLAIIVFIFPGSLFYFVIKARDWHFDNYLGIIPIGFTLSITIITVVGLVGRLIGSSFLWVKTVFFLIGLVEIIVLARLEFDLQSTAAELVKTVRSGWKNFAFILAVILVVLMAFHDYFFLDDASYMAYSTNWQYSTSLGFENLVHNVENVEHIRFWLAIFPMTLSLLADLSGLPGILLYGNYLELFMLPIALFSGYWFCRQLGFTRKMAGISILTQVTLFAWMTGKELPVGLWFYQSMSEDKLVATFIIAPAVFIFGLDVVQNPTKRKWILFGSIALGMMLTHPIILFFASAILFSMAGLAWLNHRTTWRQILYLILVIVVMMIPYLIIVSVSTPSTGEVQVADARDSHNVDLFVRYENNNFYGLSPNSLKFTDLEIGDSFIYQLFRLTPVLISLAAAAVSLRYWRKGPVYWYVLSCVLLITLATIPYTGWILGYFVMPRMLARSAWFIPLGVGSVLLLKSLNDQLKNRNKSIKFKNISITFIYSMICFLFISPILFGASLPRALYYFSYLHTNKQLDRIGSYIDAHSSSPVMGIALDYGDTQYLPGVSAKIRLISFRDYNVNPHSFFMSEEEINQRIYASETIRSLNSSTDEVERCSLIEKYDLRYVISRSEDADRYQDLVSFCEADTQFVFETEDFALIEFFDE